jgi:hypothetical protein
MICVQLNGGLGNQMFQYACGRAIANKHRTELVLDLSQLHKKVTAKGITKRSFALDIFKIKSSEITLTELHKIKPLIFRLINTLSIKIRSKGIQTPTYFVENKFNYNTNIKIVGKKCFLSGYWQSAKYFNCIEAEIRKEFTFPNSLTIENEEYLNKIKFTNSVSLHIRRTDFIDNITHDIHGFCPLDYYKEAIEIINNKIKDPVFFIFSDDIEWAKKNLQLNYACSFISGNDKIKSYIDMQLMSACKHNIIANSSFSWWGAWLNLNTSKIVIAPKVWFIDKKLNNQTFDLIPNTWIRI